MGRRVVDPFTVRLALTGDLQAYERRNSEAVLKGLKDGAYDIADMGKKKLRDALISSGLKLNPKSWQAEVHPRGSILAWKPAVFFYTKAPKIIAAFDEGGEIRAKDGFMAVPLPYYQELLPRQRGQYSKSKIQLTYEKYGEDNLIVLPATSDRPAILALDSGKITATGKITGSKRTKTGKRRKGTGLIPLFYLVESVEIQQRLNVEKTFNEIERDSPRLVVAALERHLRMVE